MSNIRGDGYHIYDPDHPNFRPGDNDEAYQILVGDLKRVKQQLAGLAGTANKSGVGSTTIPITAAQVSQMITGAVSPYGFRATIAGLTGTFNAGTSATITYTSSDWDTTGGAWNNTAFIVPANGLYQIMSVGVFFYGATAVPDIALGLLRNGATALAVPGQQMTLAGNAPLLTVPNCLTANLAQGDAISSYYVNNTGVGGVYGANLTILRLGANP